MRNIIITGGGLENKGAQAMTFITVNELAKRFPEHRIVVLSYQDMRRPASEREQYRFEFADFQPIKFARAQKNPILKLICCLRNAKQLAETEALYRNSDLMVDISGYALGSNWSYAVCNAFLENIEYAKAFGIPVYLMPQSFGPFDFSGEHAAELVRRIKKALEYAQKVCTREQEGYDLVNRSYCLANTVLCGDLVLNNKGIDLCNVYRTLPELDIPKIKADSVCIIPNTRNESVGDKNKILELYSCLISRLAEKKKTIYIMMHSSQDAELCREIKLAYADETNVILLDKDYSCIEFNEIVKQFDFVIASRYHSIVHAYKNGIPCLVLGWATKYHELLKQFGQLDYMFDFRGNVDTESLLAAMDKLIEARDEESKRILNELDKIQQDNVFDILELK